MMRYRSHDNPVSSQPHSRAVLRQPLEMRSSRSGVTDGRLQLVPSLQCAGRRLRLGSLGDGRTHQLLTCFGLEYYAGYP